MIMPVGKGSTFLEKRTHLANASCHTRTVAEARVGVQIRDANAIRACAYGHLLLPSWQAGVGDHDANEPFWHRSSHSQADQPTPIVHDDGGIGNVHTTHEVGDPAHMACVRDVTLVRKLVALAEPDQIRTNDAVSSIYQGRDDFTPQVGPG